MLMRAPGVVVVRLNFFVGLVCWGSSPLSPQYTFSVLGRALRVLPACGSLSVLTKSNKVAACFGSQNIRHRGIYRMTFRDFSVCLVSRHMSSFLQHRSAPCCWPVIVTRARCVGIALGLSQWGSHQIERSNVKTTGEYPCVYSGFKLTSESVLNASLYASKRAFTLVRSATSASSSFNSSANNSGLYSVATSRFCTSFVE